MKVSISQEDLINANLHLVQSVIMDANMTAQKEKRVKSLIIAKTTIEKTLSMMGFNPEQ